MLDSEKSGMCKHKEDVVYINRLKCNYDFYSNSIMIRYDG